MHILIAHGRCLYESVGKKLLRVLRVSVVHLSLSNFNTETRSSQRLQTLLFALCSLCAIGQNRRVLRRFFARESRQLTRIMIGFRPAI